LRYLDGPQAALEEMVRVARPGGSVLAFDLDSNLTVVDAPDAVLARRMAMVLDAAVPHPWIGRQLLGLFQRAGLHDVRVVPARHLPVRSRRVRRLRATQRGTIDRAMHAGQVTPGRVAAWWGALEQAKDAGTFFAANLGFIATGRKPWERDG
jgi:hypothetical protein